MAVSRTPSHPRLIDVARRAGVSMRTVSNVVNDFPYVTSATREKVETAIAELGYQPNLVARNLARGRTGLMALVLPKLEMPYFAALAQQMLEVAEAEGLFLVIQQTHESHALELAALEGRFGQRIDGIVLSPTTLTSADVMARRSPIPLVLLGDRDWTGVATSVGIDHVAAARAAVTHLLTTGRRRVAIVGPDLGTGRRLAGWAAALAEGGLVADPALKVMTDGQRIARMEPRPDAVFCVTDWLALGVMRGLQRSGLAVPDDIAVVGYDDIPYGRAANPTLTTIAPDRAEIARLAISSALAGASEPVTHLAEWRLVVRESTAR
jgi:DNA-binding LacI/PurR family transcriptional regulator